MMPSSESAEICTISRYSRCSGDSSVSSASSVMPMTPFIGVRISWLMLARNSLLARLAASAASRACRSASSACLRSVMSMIDPSMSGVPSRRSSTMIAFSSAHITRPSRRSLPSRLVSACP